MATPLVCENLASDIRRPLQQGRGGALDLLECVRMGVLAASSHNTQPWRFRLHGPSLAIYPDFTRRCPVVDPDDAHLYKSLGCAAENVVQAAAFQGYTAAVTYEPSPDRIRIEFSRGVESKSTAMARAIVVRQCTKLPYDGRPLAHEVIEQLERAGQGEGVRTLLITERSQIQSIGELIALGNRIQLTDPAFRKELIAWIRFNPRSAAASGDGLSGHVTRQPALADWLAPWLVDYVLTAKKQIATDTAHLLSSSALVVTVATGNERSSWIEAGRVWQRFALQAAALGVRTAFVNQPIEVAGLRGQLSEKLGLSGVQPMLMVRAGYGPLAPFSLRRPLQDVIDTAQPDSRGAP
jgi:hypothetical protein